MDTLRHSGRSTRIIDSAVQALFNEGTVTLGDHHFGEVRYDPDANRRATAHAFNILVRRLFIEHGGPERFKVDTERFKISLSDYYYDKFKTYENSSKNNPRDQNPSEHGQVSDKDQGKVH